MFQFFYLNTCVLQPMFSTVAKYRQVCAQSGRHNYCELSIHHDCTCRIADVYFTHPGMNDSQQTHLSDNQFASSVLNVHLRGVIIQNATDEYVYGCVETISQGFFILPVQDESSQKCERPIKTIKPLLGFRKCNQSRTKKTGFTAGTNATRKKNSCQMGDFQTIRFICQDDPRYPVEALNPNCPK